MKKIILILITATLFYSCNSDSPVTPPNDTVPSDYNKILTLDKSGMKLEIWSATGQNLCYGYNDIGFKVFINGTEKKTGYLKFKPIMYHDLGGPIHSTPSKEKFYFDNNKNLFSGYVCFNMLSDSLSHWFGNFNYNEEANMDTVFFNVVNLTTNQLRAWDDYIGGYSYIMTLIKPVNPGLGLNTFTCLLHRTSDDLNYHEVDSADMFIKPWMVAHGHGSSNNVNPSRLGGGKYEGKVNFTMPGYWEVQDSIKINGTFITYSPHPKFSFTVQ